MQVERQVEYNENEKFDTPKKGGKKGPFCTSSTRPPECVGLTTCQEAMNKKRHFMHLCIVVVPLGEVRNNKTKNYRAFDTN
jgi:hypothetical protein